MKVHVKKEDKNTIIPGIIITVIFLTFSISVFIVVITNGKSLIDNLSSLGMVLPAALIFFILGVIFLYALIKRPKGYNSKLINKKIETYKGKQITYMEFNIGKEQDEEEEEGINIADYKCYTIGENNLIVGNDYSLKIKEFNWEPKYVEEINSSTKSKKNKVAKKVSNITLSPVIIIVSLFFGTQIFLCILGLIMYPEYTSTYLIVSGFCILAIFYAIMLSKK